MSQALSVPAHAASSLHVSLPGSQFLRCKTGINSQLVYRGARKKAPARGSLQHQRRLLLLPRTVALRGAPLTRYPSLGLLQFLEAEQCEREAVA